MDVQPRRFRAYASYRTSDIAWLGATPAHWKTHRMAHLTKAISGGTPSKENPEYWKGTIPWVSPKDMKVRVIRDAADHISDDAVEQAGLSLIAPPAVLIVVRGMILAHTFPVAMSAVPVTINQDMKALEIAGDVAPEYLSFLLEGIGGYLLTLVEEAGHGTKLVRTDLWRAIKVSLPPRDEQHAITVFLDRETAKIDALVAKKRQLIDLLHEKRTAFITHAVTKGLDSSVPMRDSGVEWLGAIPQHWPVESIRWVARMESGHTPDKKVPAYWDGGGIPWLSLGDTAQLRVVDKVVETATETTVAGINNSSARVLPAGTVAFSRDASIGLCAILGRPMAVSQHFIGWVCGDSLDNDYLLLSLRSMTYELDRLTMGATVKTIGMPDVKGLRIALPPLNEQTAIVHLVRSGLAKLDRLSQNVKDAIDRLLEFRAALISAAVTGKIDVREEVA
jgi:type I restriction enzyme S subunit